MMKVIDYVNLNRLRAKATLIDLPSLEKAEPTALLDAAMKFVQEHPQLHDQAHWMCDLSDSSETNVKVAQVAEAPICGTAACLAGWGIALHNKVEGVQILDTTGEVILAGGKNRVGVGQYAAQLFGITHDQADTLFASHWTVAALSAGVEAIKADPDIDEHGLYIAMRSAE